MKLCVVVLLSGATLPPQPMDCVGQGIKADVGVFERSFSHRYLYLCEKRMNFWLFGGSSLLVLSGLQVVASIQSPPPPTCGQFPASFLAVIDQNIDAPDAFIVADPELTFFKQVLGFRDIIIEQTFDNAIKFFNETYGLDFSLSPPTDQNEYFYQNAKMGPYRLADGIDYQVTLNNWIQTGNTRSTCYRIRDGGFRVTFSADQLLHGSYGGAGGLPVRVTNALGYGFYHIDACRQSPMIIQFQSGAPLRQEPIDGTNVLNFYLYNRVLGYGKAYGLFTIKPDPEEPGEYRIVARNVFTFSNE